MVVLKYHSPPNYSINPPDKGGFLKLGSILKSIDTADEPLNHDCHVPIPQNTKQTHTQRGFTARQSAMTRGDYGVWAKLFGVEAAGGQVSWAHGRSGEDVFHFREVYTEYFIASREYARESMGRDEVDFYVNEAEKPVYLVTGLKTARGPSVWSAEGKSDEVKFELGLHQPGGIPVELGPKLDSSRERRREMGFEDSDDFVVGIRVKELVYRKHRLKRKRGELSVEEFNTGAVLAGDDDEDEEADGDELVGFEDDGVDGTECVERVVGENDEVVEEAWVVGRK
ncbi:hypothetical protein CONLIGDRAFT_708492 [Coniochaeta ligniaria NRRL 30616]|uniref:Uncharacterized protein n=1 Tax=Coniochaeta ligniaria NRRL 30616 TaxID=1408157 RepID=A0A1J7IDG1_9PEZI|nr:hypothetical protein CONLIGDRAFT_708492 [Coniochaeta ligniaria NRRL 30616]